MGIRWRNGGAGRSGWLWKDLIAITVRGSRQDRRVNIIRTQIAFMILFALVIAMAMKIVGILLVTALLIIPAAAAGGCTHAEQMAIFAAIAGSIAVALGLQGSLLWDLSGPAIVVAAALIFIPLAVPIRMRAG